jgi:virulence-associated protein VagC
LPARRHASADPSYTAATRGSGALARTRPFRHDGSRAARVPETLRPPEGEVTVHRHGRGVLIEPVQADLEELFRRWNDAFGPDFMAEGRDQPAMPTPRKIWD